MKLFVLSLIIVALTGSAGVRAQVTLYRDIEDRGSVLALPTVGYRDTSSARIMVANQMRQTDVVVNSISIEPFRDFMIDSISQTPFTIPQGGAKRLFHLRWTPRDSAKSIYEQLTVTIHFQNYWGRDTTNVMTINALQVNGPKKGCLTASESIDVTLPHPDSYMYDKTITFTNTSTRYTVTIDSLRFRGVDASAFSTTALELKTLKPGASTTVHVNFAPNRGFLIPTYAARLFAYASNDSCGPAQVSVKVNYDLVSTTETQELRSPGVTTLYMVGDSTELNGSWNIHNGGERGIFRVYWKGDFNDWYIRYPNDQQVASNAGTTFKLEVLHWPTTPGVLESKTIQFFDSSHNVVKEFLIHSLWLPKKAPLGVKRQMNSQFSLVQNPSRAGQSLSVKLPAEENMTLEVFDALGRSVIEQVRVPSGARHWNFTPSSAGSYFIRLTGGNDRQLLGTLRAVVR